MPTACERNVKLHRDYLQLTRTLGAHEFVLADGCTLVMTPIRIHALAADYQSCVFAVQVPGSTSHQAGRLRPQSAAPARIRPPSAFAARPRSAMSGAGAPGAAAARPTRSAGLAAEKRLMRGASPTADAPRQSRINIVAASSAAVLRSASATFESLHLGHVATASWERGVVKMQYEVRHEGDRPNASRLPVKPLPRTAQCTLHFRSEAAAAQFGALLSSWIGAFRARGMYCEGDPALLQQQNPHPQQQQAADSSIHGLSDSLLGSPSAAVRRPAEETWDDITTAKLNRGKARQRPETVQQQAGIAHASAIDAVMGRSRMDVWAHPRNCDMLRDVLVGDVGRPLKIRLDADTAPTSSERYAPLVDALRTDAHRAVGRTVLFEAINVDSLSDDTLAAIVGAMDVRGLRLGSFTARNCPSLGKRTMKLLQRLADEKDSSFFAFEMSGNNIALDPDSYNMFSNLRRSVGHNAMSSRNASPQTLRQHTPQGRQAAPQQRPEAFHLGATALGSPR